MTKRVMWLASLAVAGLLAGPAYGQDSDPISTATYTCAEGKSMVAMYYPDLVELTLKDGRKFSLPQVISGSGTRYANGDESIQFWSKGKTAFLTEGSDDNITYKDCIAD